MRFIMVMMNNITDNYVLWCLQKAVHMHILLAYVVVYVVAERFRNIQNS